MTNPYIPMSTELLLGDVYDFIDQEPTQEDFNNYFEAIAEMSQRRKSGRTEREGKEIAFESMARCTDGNRQLTKWLELLRPEGYVISIYR